MLEPQSANLLSMILQYVAEGERTIEAHRQSLCRHKQFKPHEAFCRIDRQAKEQIDSYSLLQFLQENSGVGIGIGDCAKLIRFFGSGVSLSFHDFQAIVLPCEDHDLRKKVQQRSKSRIGHFDGLTYDIEFGLSNLLISEIDMQQKIENLLQELESHTDYTVQAAFRTIDCVGRGRIDGRTIMEFYRQRGVYLLEREACAIVRRIDASCSG